MKKILLFLLIIVSILSCSDPINEEKFQKNNKTETNLLSSRPAPSAEFRACYVIPSTQVTAFKNRLNNDVTLNTFLSQNNVVIGASLTSDGNSPNTPFILFTNNIQVNVNYVDLVLQIPISSLGGTTTAQIQNSLSIKVQRLIDLTKGATSIFSNGTEKPAFFGLKIPSANGLVEVKINKSLFKYPIIAKIGTSFVETKFLPNEFIKHSKRIEDVMQEQNGRNPLDDVKSQIVLERVTIGAPKVKSVNNYLEFNLVGIKAFFRNNRKFNVIAGSDTDAEQNFGSEAQLYYPLKTINGVPLTGAILVAAQKVNVAVIRGSGANIPNNTPSSDIFLRNQFGNIIIQ